MYAIQSLFSLDHSSASVKRQNQVRCSTNYFTRVPYVASFFYTFIRCYPLPRVSFACRRSWLTLFFTEVTVQGFPSVATAGSGGISSAFVRYLCSSIPCVYNRFIFRFVNSSLWESRQSYGACVFTLILPVFIFSKDSCCEP